MRQRPPRAVNQEQLQLGADRDGTGTESRPVQQLAERGQAFVQPLGEARVVALAELFPIYLGSNRRISPSRAGCRPGLWLAVAD